MPENNQILSVEGQLVGLPLAGPESFSQAQLDYLKRALGVDETVLYDVPAGTALANSTTYETSESPLNFKKIAIYAKAYDTHTAAKYIEFDPNASGEGITLVLPYKGGGVILRFTYGFFTVNSSGLSFGASTTGNLSIEVNKVTSIAQSAKIVKIVGIGRISGGN